MVASVGDSTVDCRSLRAVIDLEKLGPRTIWVDCDVLQGDGGTRTTAITGASLALAIACRNLLGKKNSIQPPMQKWLPQRSAGILDGQAIVDLIMRRTKGLQLISSRRTEDGDL